MKSYLKFLSRNKLYTAIEAVGLAVSLAFVILIGSYVVQQYEVAHESPQGKRTFVLGTNEFLGLTYWDKEELEMNIPEVDAATHAAMLWQPIVREGNEPLQCSGMETDADFFRVFPQYHLVEGSLNDFVSKDDVLISESLARKIADQVGNDVKTNGNDIQTTGNDAQTTGKDAQTTGNDTSVTPGLTGSLIGKVINVDGTDRTIKGVYADFDGTFFMPYDIITHISGAWGAGMERNFGSIGNYTTWFRARDDADAADVRAKVKALLHKNYDPIWGAEKVDAWKVYRMDEAFFITGNSNGLTRQGNARMLRLLTVVVLLLLLSAIFNYVNLSLALTGKRAKEMATRRLLGADKTSILWKYIGESVAFTAVCFGAALLLADLLVPMMNSLVSTADPDEMMLGMGDTSVRLSFLLTSGYIVAYLAGIMVLGVINGLLPAVVASRYQPIDVIKGTLRRRNKMVMSKVFIVVQNVLSVFLIALALVMEVQMRHMLTRPMHAATENLYYIEYSAKNYDAMKLFKDKVEQLPFVTKAGVGRGIPGMINMTMGVKVDEVHRVDMPVILCDSTYFKLLGLEVEEDFGHPLVHSLWMSRSAFNAAAVSDTSTVFPRRINMNGAQPEFIGGVVTDFPARPASEGEINPNGGVIVTRAEELHYANCLLIGTTGEDRSYDEAIRQAYREFRMETSGVEEPAWRYGFVHDIHRKMLAPVQRTLRLVELFAVLAVLISLLGLLAMSTYFADENTKQIAVRKVFGADVNSETRRAVRSYMILVGAACLIGIPPAVWASRLYLERFAYRIEGYGWVFALAVLISLAIAFGTVLWQTLKAAKTNPSTELKKE
ncbi:MAG: ABC transporter permease [Bacteroidales bacterium]|nr:ABC transporter permease [Bacteroidales bacterium]